MTNKRKQLARRLAAKTGVSYQGAINQLNKNSDVETQLLVGDRLWLHGEWPMYTVEAVNPAMNAWTGRDEAGHVGLYPLDEVPRYWKHLPNSPRQPSCTCGPNEACGDCCHEGNGRAVDYWRRVLRRIDEADPETQSIDLHTKYPLSLIALGLQANKLPTWTFALTPQSLTMGKASPKPSPAAPYALETEIKALFQSPFQSIPGVPKGLCWDFVQVHMRFENEDGSCWGMEHDYTSVGSTFFQTEFTMTVDGKTSVHPMNQYNPWFIVARAWQLLRSQVHRDTYPKGFNPLPKDSIDAIAELQVRDEWYQVGLFERFGYPVRLVITLDRLKTDV